MPSMLHPAHAHNRPQRMLSTKPRALIAMSEQSCCIANALSRVGQVFVTAPTSEGGAIVVSGIIGGHCPGDAGEDEHWKKHPQGHKASCMSVINSIFLTSLYTLR